MYDVNLLRIYRQGGYAIISSKAVNYAGIYCFVNATHPTTIYFDAS